MNQQLWQSRVNLQHAQQRLHRLEKGHSHPLLRVLGEDVTDLQIRLSETFLQWKAKGVRLITAFEQSMLTRHATFEGNSESLEEQVQNLSIVRLDIQATVKHAAEFLEFLNGLGKATGGWPSEIRACDVRRMPSQTLDARCVVDIYHWAAEGYSDEARL